VGPQIEDGAVAVVDPNFDSQSLLVLHMLIGCATQTATWPNLRENTSFFEATGSSATVLGIRTVVFRWHLSRGRGARAPVQKAKCRVTVRSRGAPPRAERARGLLRERFACATGSVSQLTDEVRQRNDHAACPYLHCSNANEHL